METNQATEHLQVIRTLMERSALYRRALAPIMTFCGAVGILAGIGGWLLGIISNRSFVLFWTATAGVALTGSLLLVRRQAMKESEPFWSAPTKRVTQAMLPPLFVGIFPSLMVWIRGGAEPMTGNILCAVWATLFGCALHSAGFVISRGFRIFGWNFIAIGCFFLILAPSSNAGVLNPHLMMGGLFGGLHFAYGIYLYFTENRKTAP